MARSTRRDQARCVASGLVCVASASGHGANFTMPGLPASLGFLTSPSKSGTAEPPGPGRVQRPNSEEPMMTTLPKKGDKVSWGTPQGETHGTVETVVTSTVKIKSHVAKATKEHPEVLVKSDKSGKEAVHKPESLKQA
jgi:hypothetical protein